MSGQLLLINPRKRHSKKRRYSRRRKMSARQRMYFGKRRRHYSKRRRNPIRIVRHHKRRYSKRRHARRYSRRRHNPISLRGLGGGARGVVGKVTHAATGALGAILVDILMGYGGRWLPANVQTPITATGGVNPWYYVTKLTGALLVGMFGRKLPLVGRYAERFAEGSMTVTLYGAIKQVMPAGLTLGDVGYMNPGFIPADADVASKSYIHSLSAYTNGVGAYTSGMGDTGGFVHEADQYSNANAY